MFQNQNVPAMVPQCSPPTEVSQGAMFARVTMLSHKTERSQTIKPARNNLVAKDFLGLELDIKICLLTYYTILHA